MAAAQLGEYGMPRDAASELKRSAMQQLRETERQLEPRLHEGAEQLLAAIEQELRQKVSQARSSAGGETQQQLQQAQQPQQQQAQQQQQQQQWCSSQAAPAPASAAAGGVSAAEAGAAGPRIDPTTGVAFSTVEEVYPLLQPRLDK
jgi:hypothetical protein